MALTLAILAVGGLIAWQRLGSSKQRRGDLWRVVHYICVSDQVTLGHPSPCVRVNQTAGFVLVPVFPHVNELLLVPTRRITGIEDPTLLMPGLPNYWEQAWAARRYLRNGTRRIPDSWVGLAVNSAFARTQDQLHIHIDCIKASVHLALETAPRIGRRWTRIEPLPGHHYYARFLRAGSLPNTSLFESLARAVGNDPASMGRQTLVLIGAPDPPADPGYYILRQAFDPESGSTGLGEELLDHRCRALPSRLTA